jgi:hypothetical protein
MASAVNSNNPAISPAQHLANVANALRSTGPRTEEGKAKARYNARRHGLTGQFYVMDEADRLAYNEHEAQMLAILNPADYYERQLAIALAQDHWRINRVKGIEFNSYGLGHHQHAAETNADTAETETAITQAQTWRADNKHFSNIALYETRLHRMIAKNKKELDQLQTKRKAAESAAREEAELLLEEKLAEQDPINPAQPISINGFVFSTQKLLTEMAHKQAVAEARWYKSRNWDRSRQPPFVLLTFPKAA